MFVILMPAIFCLKLTMSLSTKTYREWFFSRRFDHEGLIMRHSLYHLLETSLHKHWWGKLFDLQFKNSTLKKVHSFKTYCNRMLKIKRVCKRGKLCTIKVIRVGEETVADSCPLTCTLYRTLLSKSEFVNTGFWLFLCKLDYFPHPRPFPL